MAAIPAALAWIGAGLGISHYGGDIMNKDNKNGHNQQNQYGGPPVYHIQAPPSQNFGVGSLITAVAVGGGVVVFFGAYKFFFGSNPLDKIIPELEESSKQTLEQVRRADENARVRSQQMDENNRQRLLQLRAEMQGESRGNFEVLSEQLNCLTQIALQTLTTVTPNEQLAITSGGNYDDQSLAEIRNQRTNITEYAQRAQKVADEIADPSYHESKRTSAAAKIRAQIPELPAITPGGNSSTDPRGNLSGPHDLNEAPRNRNRRRLDGNNRNTGLFGFLGGLI